MNKIISTKERVFISLVGPSGSGKTQLIRDWLVFGTFQTEFDKIYYFLSTLSISLRTNVKKYKKTLCSFKVLILS